MIISVVTVRFLLVEMKDFDKFRFYWITPNKNPLYFVRNNDYLVHYVTHSTGYGNDAPVESLCQIEDKVSILLYFSREENFPDAIGEYRIVYIEE